MPLEATKSVIFSQNCPFRPLSTAEDCWRNAFNSHRCPSIVVVKLAVKIFPRTEASFGVMETDDLEI
jgi:hypothetical protein